MKKLMTFAGILGASFFCRDSRSFAAPAQPVLHTFTLTAEQETIVISQAHDSGLSVDEFIDANCIQKFLAEIINREIEKDSKNVKFQYEKVTDDQKIRIKAILNEGR